MQRIILWTMFFLPPLIVIDTAVEYRRMMHSVAYRLGEVLAIPRQSGG